VPTCLFCAEELERGTTKCPHCGESLDTERTSVGLARWRGDALLVMADGGRITARGCVVCGAGEATPSERTYVYTPPWAYLLYLGVLVGFVPLLVVALLVRKRARVWTPLCSVCLQRWRRADAVRLGYALVGVVAIPGLLGFAADALGGGDAAWGGVGLGLALWIGGLAALHFAFAHGRLRCTRIEDGEVSLAFPDLVRIRPLVDLPKL
jgi:hypothetical protein